MSVRGPPNVLCVCVYQLYQLSFFAMLHPENRNVFVVTFSVSQRGAPSQARSPLEMISGFSYFETARSFFHNNRRKTKSITAVAGKSAESLTVEVSATGPAPRAAGRHPSWGSAPILQRGGFRSAATPLPKRCAERGTLDHLSCTSSDIDLAQPTDVPVFSLSSRLPAHRPCCPGRRDDLVFRLQRGPHLP